MRVVRPTTIRFIQVDGVDPMRVHGGVFVMANTETIAVNRMIAMQSLVGKRLATNFLGREIHATNNNDNLLEHLSTQTTTALSNK